MKEKSNNPFKDNMSVSEVVGTLPGIVVFFYVYFTLDQSLESAATPILFLNSVFELNTKLAIVITGTLGF